MKDFLESSAAILRQYLGFDIPAQHLSIAVGAVSIFSLLIYLLRQLRLKLGDLSALPSEMLATAEIVKNDIQTNVDALLIKFTALHDEMRLSLHSRFDAIHKLLQATHEVSNQVADSEIAEDEASQRPPRMTRVQYARAIATKVTEQWLSGRTLRSLADSPHVFEFEGALANGQHFKLRFGTPYRQGIGVDGRLPFTLDVWVDGYKHLNYEWDTDGNYALRGFKKGSGEWLVELAAWGLKSESVAKAA
ncbi:MAG TPA: hypothetical protein PK264_16185 [Hyphomicrobiaceae bacterium]|nr:hypothetical protein [Hyphomicrobiaceae bacterium]